MQTKIHKVLFFALLLSFTQGLVYGAISAENKKVADEKISNLLDDYYDTEGRTTGGFGCTVLMGRTNANRALGYPDSSYGINMGLGFTYRKYFNQPSEYLIERAANRVSEKVPELEERRFRDRVKDDVGQRWFPYAGLNSILVILPAVDCGMAYDFSASDGKGAILNAGVSLGGGLGLMPNLGVQYSF